MTDDIQSTDKLPITGRVVLTAGDNLAFLFGRMRRLFLIAFLTSTIIAILIWFLALSTQQLDYYLQHPWLGFKRFCTEMFPVILGYIGLFLAIAVFFAWLAHRRMPLANRTLSYHADFDALTTSDASGAVLTLPWALVRKTHVTKQLLLMQLTTRAWRFLPFRAFAADDQQRLIALATRLGPCRERPNQVGLNR